MKTISQMWADYQRHTVPANAGADQVKDTHQAFMAGFITCFKIVERIGDADVPEALGLEIMSALNTEIDQFTAAKLRQAGR